MLRHLFNLRCTVNFWLRRHLRWQRKGYQEAAGNNLFLFAENGALFHRETILLKAYPSLQHLQACCEAQRYRENLNLLWLLHQKQALLYFQALSPKQTLRCLEIGFKNWSTLPALVIFLAEHWQGPIEIIGVELDLWRVYHNGHSRYDALKFHLQEAKKLLSEMDRGNIDIHWEEGDIRKHQADAYDFILWSLPFVFQEPHRAWGLPPSYFDPQACLEHVVSSLLSESGCMLSSHQGKEEALQQQNLLKNVSRKPEIRLNEVVEQPFLKLKHSRYIQIIQQSQLTHAKAPQVETQSAF